ncbi:patatin-like phospholipase family protein [Frigidibacter sp. MR17.14]|uniref:patatin-like phospholipase family protein n=1 Tax=Frigidibacter sp. MR17.14 TaxID=3126509 RepID=UPI003012D9E7
MGTSDKSLPPDEMWPPGGPRPVNVALACQGGGAQTAFTAGALSLLLERVKDGDTRFRIVGLSGTSGGAICAALTWRDLLLGVPEGGSSVERFWKTGYPAGNAAFGGGSLTEDWLRLWQGGHVFGQNTAASLRNWSAAAAAWMTDLAWVATPFQPEVGLKAGYWKQLFDTIDATVPGQMADQIADLMRPAFVHAAARPELRPLATFWAELLDLSPLHSRSLLSETAPPLARRDFDVLDAFRAVLAQHLDKDTLERLGLEISGRDHSGHFVPELLIGAADAVSATVQGAGSEPSDAPDVAAAKARTRALSEPGAPHRWAGATNYRIFRGSERLDDLLDCLLASAAIPEVMRGVAMDGTVMWDGLYAGNPPISDLPDVQSEPGSRPTRPELARDTRQSDDPDEIWVIRINPMRIPPGKAGHVLSDAAEIADRRNELSGNLPMLQEIQQVMRIGGVTRNAGKPDARYYRPVAFGFIDMSEDLASTLDHPSKMNTSASQIAALFADGQAQMAAFLTRWQTGVARQTQPVQPQPIPAQPIPAQPVAAQPDPASVAPPSPAAPGNGPRQAPT